MIEVVRISESAYCEMLKEKPKESAVIAMKRKPYPTSATFADILRSVFDKQEEMKG